jgi:23S rRNA-/tRNA-specific pseudouridylate synthase
MTARRGGREVRWVVRAEDPLHLSELLGLLDEVPSAIEEGRVFVDGRRARADRSLEPGQSVVVRRGRTASATPIRIALRRAGLVAVDKPADLPTEPDASGSHCLRQVLQQQLGVSLHAVSRLDVGVSGVVLLAETTSAMQYMERADTRARYARRYLAIANGVVVGAAEWSSPLRGKPARTQVTPLAAAPDASLLLLSPITGRTHQLRAHAAAAGAALFGDRRHGGPAKVVTADGRVRELGRIMLHAFAIELDAPDGAPFSARVGAPPEFSRCWQDLGGHWDALSPFAGTAE